MDHYEELGVSRTASVDDIRNAQRVLSRLLQPDQQTDPALRGAAEIQLRRLNAIVEGLLEPARRRAYDDALRGGPGLAVPPAVELPQTPPPRLLGWIGVAATSVVVVLIALDLLAGDFTNWTATPPEVDWTAGAHAASAPRPPAVRERMPASGSREARPAAAGRPASTAEAPGHREPRATPSPSLAGVWLLPSSGRVSGQAELMRHAPNYIRVEIQSGPTSVFGQYAAEYASSDRPSPPSVSFSFQGPAASDSGVFNWTASDGSRGGIQLRLLSPRSLQVTWQATEFGTALGVAGGAAILSRVAGY